MSAFQTAQQAESHARSVLAKFDNDANDPGVAEYIAKTVAIYPGPYRSAFKRTIEARRKWMEKQTRFITKK